MPVCVRLSLHLAQGFCFIQSVCLLQAALMPPPTSTSTRLGYLLSTTPALTSTTSSAWLVSFSLLWYLHRTLACCC